MNITKVSLVYFSPTGGTKSVLSSIAEGFSPLPVTHINMTLPKWRAKQYTVNEGELLVIGFPVYGGRLPQVYASILSQLVGNVKYVLPVVVYGNRAYDDALLELVTVCKEKGYTPVAAGAFIGEHSYSTLLAANRPNERDKDEAKEFGQAVYKAMQLDKTFDTSCVPGNIPFKPYGPKMPVAPETGEGCIQCMICANECPMQAISYDDVTVIDVEKCILCAACVKKCPTSAKKITFEPLLARVKVIVEDNINPKEPQLFLAK